jgi:membrane-associated protease RseP (regulator of RpoE activity)
MQMAFRGGAAALAALIIPLAHAQAYVDRYAEPDKTTTGLGHSADDWPVPYWLVDTAMSSMLMLLAAVDQGLGALFFGIFDHEAELLVDLAGRVVGINQSIATAGSNSGGLGQQSAAGNIGIGFAIPVDEAQRVAQQLLKGQTVTHAVLGVSASDVTGGGARIEAVTASSGAAKAGLQVGDVVTKVDSTTVSDATELTAAIRAHSAGDRVQLTYTRSGSSHTTTATLGSGS